MCEVVTQRVGNNFYDRVRAKYLKEAMFKECFEENECEEKDSCCLQFNEGILCQPANFD